MKELRKITGLNHEGKAIKLTLVAGPVIIDHDEVLLVKHGLDKFWKFPGGTVIDTLDLKTNMLREAEEELGLQLELLSDEPFIFHLVETSDWLDNIYVLYHYRCKLKSEKIKTGKDVYDWDWFNINQLPEDLALNIKPVINHLTDNDKG